MILNHDILTVVAIVFFIGIYYQGLCDVNNHNITLTHSHDDVRCLYKTILIINQRITVWCTEQSIR